MSEKDSALYFLHMLERVERIQAYTATGRESFFSDRLIQDAVIRNFEVMGKHQNAFPTPKNGKSPRLSPGSESPDFAMFLVISMTELI